MNIIKKILANKKSISSLLLIFIVVFSLIYFNGWFGYEKWKYDRITFGDREESIRRQVFVKDLKYYSSIKLKKFQIYIEKKYKYGYIDRLSTRFENNNKYRFQVSFDGLDSNNERFYNVYNFKDFDSLKNELFQRPIIYLKEPVLRDTLILQILKFKNTKDSIGYIKIWE